MPTNLYNIYPLLVLGGIIGMFSIIFIVAYATMKNKKEAIGFDRHMKDSEIIVRLLRYAKPYLPQFLLVGLIMLVSIAYDIVSPLVIGELTDSIKEGFELSYLYTLVALYASILVVAILAALFSVLFYYVFTAVSSGCAIIISTIGAALLGAVLFPVKPEEEEEQA